MKHILYKNINDISINELNEFYNIIHNDKKIKINKITDKRNKYMSILGEYLLSQLLKEYCNIDYSNLIFQYNDNGKPFISNYSIYFNISHSHEFVVCIISDKECGIDIELIRQVPVNTIKSFASENEQKYILKKDIYKRIFEIYTLKEAYIKMNGLNLTNINDAEFKINNNTISSSDNTAHYYLDYSIKEYIIAYTIKK